MGFFNIPEFAASAPVKKKATGVLGVSVKMLHEQECKACPLNHADVCNPKSSAAGANKDVLIYVLGSAPSRLADKTRTAWAGEGFRLIKRLIPNNARSRVRWGNVIRTHPGVGEPVIGNDKGKTEYETTRTPTPIEIECCRPSVVADIERAKPKAIFSFGAEALRWVCDETHAYLWAGRRIPVRVGNHECWLYPFQRAEDVIKDRKWEGHVPDWEATWERHIRNAVRDVLNDDLPKPVIHTKEKAEANLELIDGSKGKADLKRVRDVLDECRKYKLTGLDYETKYYRPFRDGAKVLTAAAACKTVAASIAFDHKQAGWSDRERDALDEMWEDFLYDEDVIKVAHQLSFEMEWSAYHWGKDVLRASRWEDTISQAYILNETQGMLSLETLCMQYFGINMKALSVLDKNKLDDEPLPLVLRYNAIDGKYHRWLHMKQNPQIDTQNLRPQYEHQLRRVPTLVLTTMKGVPLNQKEVRDYRKKYDAMIKDAEAELREIPIIQSFARQTGAAFRPTADRDVRKLIAMCGHKMPRNKDGKESTDADAMRQIKEPWVKPMSAYKKAAKVLSTYVDAVTEGKSEHVYPDGLLHPVISTYKVKTWRTSSEEPNIQNWPKRGPNVVIRKQVAARPGHKIVSIDYAAIQGRNVAMESRDKKLIAAFIDNYDIHTDWAIWFAKHCPKWALDGFHKDKAVLKAARGGVKNQFVFPTFFGAQPKGIATNLANSGKCAVPVNIVEEAQEEFFDHFKGVKRWHEHLQAYYKQHGYVTGLSGFRRRAPVSFNELINAPIQADEAIIVLEAMNALSELDYRKYQPIMEIHDDLTFELPTKYLDSRIDTIIREMTKVRFDWINPVPLSVEVSIGDTWADIKAVGKYESYKGGYREYH